MLRTLLPATLATLVCIAAPAGATMAQQRITSQYLEQLSTKVETQRDAYHRLDMAEKEALEEGAKERAAAFATAKAQAREKYIHLNAELQKARMAKREQDKRNAQTVPDSR